MQLFSADATIFLKKKKIAHKKLAKPPSKVGQKNLNSLFNLIALTGQNCPNRKNNVPNYGL